MITPKQIVSEISTLTTDLIKYSITNDQIFPSLRTDKNLTSIDFGKNDISFILKNKPYEDIFDQIAESRAYNFKLLDGSLIQLMYQFIDEKIHCHRLAFFPNPHFDEYQNNPEMYDNDDLFADIIMKNIVPVPIRFDFDSREGVFEDVKHPQSHLTLGQYKNCRIPVSSPLTPSQFTYFILRNFYNTLYFRYLEGFNFPDYCFYERITTNEMSLPYIKIS